MLSTLFMMSVLVMAQGSDCLSGNECPNDDDAENGVSLLQNKVTMQSTELGHADTVKEEMLPDMLVKFLADAAKDEDGAFKDALFYKLMDYKHNVDPGVAKAVHDAGKAFTDTTKGLRDKDKQKGGTEIDKGIKEAGQAFKDIQDKLQKEMTPKNGKKDNVGTIIKKLSAASHNISEGVFTNKANSVENLARGVQGLFEVVQVLAAKYVPYVTTCSLMKFKKYEDATLDQKGGHMCDYKGKPVCKNEKGEEGWCNIKRDTADEGWVDLVDVAKKPTWGYCGWSRECDTFMNHAVNGALGSLGLKE